MTTIPLSLPRQRHWLRNYALTIVALAAFVFMSLLVFEQGRVIESQRDLIRTLFGDSIALNNIRTRVIVAQQEKEKEKAAPPKAPAPELRAR